ncbi:hypothetical protein L226DRAFT_263493 [Lentinus tigrinus ALCF2SS1-7]|uniref:F-box domain-containing protein n=1 Tax=Lentinus tigrinus ALCF2SS1-6 TaxID=1328759 RepID=A0A5C2RT24_9APHY|nr:hypothetical protein L227DRAFT_534066 [Lentinus tigrinus ALCF2SS1-6]RPD69930.1 hypothetical protein L226DRAFT_263493 [Lentinus tigrinus ALCF2SS1-7]
MPQQVPILRLNEDVLNAILEILLGTGGLAELSRTSRQVRAACMPILFRECYRRMYVCLPEPDWFLPYPLWSHVQSLVIRDECYDKIDASRSRFTDNCLLCGALAGPLFEQWLPRMSRLRSVTLYQNPRNDEHSHGISWPALCAVLSIPTIRALNIDRLHVCPALRPSDELHVAAVAPLTSFQYILDKAALSSVYVRPASVQPNYTAEMIALSTALGALHESLEVLSLPTSSVPINVFSMHTWPCLRRLVLRGQPCESLVSSLLSGISHLPSLKSLVLKFSAETRTRPGILWRGEDVTSFPCPALEELVLTYPDPSDQIFDHLPPTLIALSLCCWRHLYHEFLSPYRFWIPSDGPLFALLLSSSEMCCVLRRSQTPMLVRLTLEYRADDGDEELLHHIAQAYPRLTYLKLIRYRPHGVDSVPVERITRALSLLAYLSELKVHLDLPDMPLPGLYLGRGSGGGFYSSSAIEKFSDTVEQTAGVFARELSASVKYVSILAPTASQSIWARFRIVNGKAFYEENS